uniref:Antimicrobial peptide n=1 Tax=Steinernema glaseri TaxID=37863 RepID=A0A1I8AAS8_9BILA
MHTRALLLLTVVLSHLCRAQELNSLPIGWLMEDAPLQNTTEAAIVAKSTFVGLGGLGPKVKQWWRKAERSIKDRLEGAANDIKDFFRDP